MYCVKCGQPAVDGNVYCANCGAELQKPVVVPEDEELTQETVPSVDGEEKRIKPILIIGAGVVVVVSLVLLLLNFAGIKNWFLRTASTPKDLLLTVYKQSMHTAFSPFMDNYEKLLNSAQKSEAKHQAQIVLKPGEQIMDALAYAVYAGEGDVSWLSEIRLCAEFAIQEKLQEYVLAIGLGEHDVVSAELITDSQNQKMYLSIPEMSEQALRTDMEKNPMFAYSDMETLHAALPSAEILGQLAVRYMDIVLGGFSSVEKYSESLTLDGICQDVTVLEAYIDHLDLLEVFDAFLKQVKADEDIKTIAEGLNPWYNDLMEQSMTAYNEYFESVYEPVDLYNELIASVDASLNQLQEEFKNVDPENHLYLYTYLNDSNEIVGLKLVVSGMDERISYLKLTDTEQYSMQLLLGDLEITGDGKCSESLNGSFTVSIDEQKVLDVALENFTQSNGVAYLKPSAAILNAVVPGIGFADMNEMDAAEVTLCFSFAEKEEKFQCAIDISSNENSIFTVEFLEKEMDSQEICLPDKFVDFSDEEMAYNWYSNMDFDRFFEKLTDIGVPTELIALLH